MNCYLWELEAILEGLTLKELDDQEKQAVFGFHLRYIMNSKRPKMSKIINKKNQESKIKKIFARNDKSNDKSNSRLQSAIEALNHFKNR